MLKYIYNTYETNKKHWTEKKQQKKQEANQLRRNVFSLGLKER